jgi:hypothetical protein
MEKKKNIQAVVEASADELRSLLTHTELRNWALAHNYDNRVAFPLFKKALLAINIDYEYLRDGIRAEERDRLQCEVTHCVTLFIDAKASAGRYAITDESGNPVWYGRFFDNDIEHGADEQSGAELCAAVKAVWLASKIREAAGLPVLELVLMTDAQWLTHQDGPHQKGFRLTRDAKRFQLRLDVRWIRGKDNPADRFTTGGGFMRYSERPLGDLVQPL